MDKKIRVLLVDDHTLFRSGIKSLLQRSDEFEVVDEAGDGLEGIKRARSHKPDVVLLDLHMPGVSGLEAVKVHAFRRDQLMEFSVRFMKGGSGIVARDSDSSIDQRADRSLK